MDNTMLESNAIDIAVYSAACQDELKAQPVRDEMATRRMSAMQSIEPDILTTA